MILDPAAITTMLQVAARLLTAQDTAPEILDQKASVVILKITSRWHSDITGQSVREMSAAGQGVGPLANTRAKRESRRA
jgi:hypothetical protein